MVSQKIDPRNREEFAYAGIPGWHVKGITGKGVTVAVAEGIDETDDHGRNCADVLRQIAPDAKILGRPRPTIILKNGRLAPESRDALEVYYRGLVADGVQILAMSLLGTATPDIEDLEREILIANGITPICSAGNEDGKQIASKQSAALSTWIAVGAAFLYKGKPRREPYSEVGPTLDVMGLTNIYTSWGVRFGGTSCAAQYVAGVLALIFQYVKQVRGRFPVFDEARTLLTTTFAEDMEAEGFDENTAYGLVRLPAELLEIIAPGEPPPAEPPPTDVPEQNPGGDRPMGRPRIYLSPSTQAHNLGVGDYGTEEFRMRQLAWDVGAILTRQGADVAIARVDLEPPGCVAESDAYKPLYHISLHSNSGAKGVEGFYWPGSVKGEAITRDICNALAAMNPNGLRRVEPDGTLTEIAGPDAVCAYIEVGFHDREDEAEWIVREMDGIAFAIAEVVCRHAGLLAPARPDAERKLAEIRRIVNS